MPTHTPTAGPSRSDDRSGDRADRADRGMSLIEILVTVVLLGTVVLATLAAMQASIVGTAVERDHARAHQWLQSATGVLQAAPRISCHTTGEVPAEELIREGYEEVLHTDVANPAGWSDWQITIVEPIEVWDGSRYWNPYALPEDANCFEPLYQLQLVTIQVVSPDQRIIETRQVVKGG